LPSGWRARPWTWAPPSGAKYGQGLALQPDGKIVVGVFYSQAARSSGNRLARFNADGSVDTSFGTLGSGYVGVPNPYRVLAGELALTLQPDGKIVTASRDFTLTRFDADGKLDGSFGGDGVVTTRVNVGDARDVTVQRNGKIVAAGFSVRGFAVSRYNADGSLDGTFVGDGQRLQPTLGKRTTSVAAPCS